MKPAFRFDDVLDALPFPHARLLERVARAAARAGVRLHLVGGPVRDLVLGRPLRDLDLLVETDAAVLAQAVAQTDPERPVEIERHARFGTLQLRTAEAEVDLARTRRETYAHPGALPEVEPSTLEEDVLRRDFSVNALVLPLDVEAREQAMPVIDHVGGLVDLAEGRLRVLHGRSFHDDPTRAFRGARLAARLGLELERHSRTALRDALRDGAFGAVSGERFRREVALLFEEPRYGVDAGRILQRLSDLHVLAALEPGLSLPRDRRAPLRRLSRSLESPEWPAGRFRPWVAGLSIWLAPLAAVTRRRTLERLAIRGEQGTRILRFAKEGERLLRALAKARGRGAVDAILAPLAEETLQAAFAIADVKIRRRIVRWGAEDKRRRAPVVGSDLTALGIEGPDVGRGLARIRAAFLDGELANREEALVLAQELARRSARAPKRRARPGARARARSRPSPPPAASATEPRARPARPRPVAPDGSILDTAPRPRTQAGDLDQEIRSADAPIADVAPVSAPDPDPPEKRASRTEPKR